jgi:hypothetical protein
LVRGQAATDGDPYRGWLLGHFIDSDDGMRKTDALEIKWGIHPAGQQRADWNTDEPRTTLLLMIRGRFRLDLPVGTVLLEREGDYVLGGAGIGHSWQAQEGSVVVTTRWPSLPLTMHQRH